MSTKIQEQLDTRYMRAALDAAAQGLAAGEVPIGAVLVLDDRIIATAHNASVTDSDPTAHAEVLALREGCKVQRSPRLDGATLLVFGTREPRTGGVVSITDTLMNPANTHHIAVTEGVIATDATQLMQQFFSKRR